MAFKKTFVVSDESVNSYGFRIITAGIRLENAKKNCPCFYDHKTWDIPLGHWENFRIENNRLLADLVINGDNEREKNYIKKIENKDIQGCSVGADPLKWNEDPLQMMQGQTRPTCEECELIEISITPLPGNNGALALKHEGSLITLNSTNENIIIPNLKPVENMKRIALTLGLAEAATEDQIIDAIRLHQAKAGNADAMAAVIEDQLTEGLDTEQKAFFVKLSKTDVPAAMDYLKLNRPSVIADEDETTTTTAKKPAIVKDMKVSDIIKQGRKGGEGSEDGKDSFDYLQKKNPIELKRIHSEEPEKYQELAKAYGEGVRYTGK